MNRFYVCIFVLLCAARLQGQSDSVSGNLIKVSCNKTTSLVFPQIIKSVDLGSRDLLARKVGGAENVLLVKAAKENFNETNLTVITADGKLYSFTLCYSAYPLKLVIQMDSSGSAYEKIAARKRTIHGVRDEKYNMVLRLKGVFIQQETLYFQLELENFSNISYLADPPGFYIMDRKQSRRTAIQQLEQVPLYLYGNTGLVPGQSKQIIVASFTQFTFPDKKLFCVRLTEKNGGRNLVLKISNKKIIKARQL